MTFYKIAVDELKHHYPGKHDQKDHGNRSKTLFVSGSSKTQDKNSPYYKDRLPKYTESILTSKMDKNYKIIVGDAPGIDRQVQDYLNSVGYKNVEIYGPGKQVRYVANKKWKTHPIDDPDHEPGSKEWLAKKDKAMQDRASEGLAVILDDGASATRKNIDALINQNKKVFVEQLNKDGSSVEDGAPFFNWLQENGHMLVYSSDDKNIENFRKMYRDYVAYKLNKESFE